MLIFEVWKVVSVYMVGGNLEMSVVVMGFGFRKMKIVGEVVFWDGGQYV